MRGMREVQTRDGLGGALHRMGRSLCQRSGRGDETFASFVIFEQVSQTPDSLTRKSET